MRNSSSRTWSKFFLAVCLCCSTVAYSQVREIKGLSGLRGGGGGGESAAAAVYALYFMMDFMVEGVVDLQVAALKRKADVPMIVSLEVFGQVASQPSTYYVFNPRVRANWGLFLTDFRSNYMIEHVPGGIEDFRTDDWQILGFYLLQQRSVNLRISSGLMHERFGNGNTFHESVIGGRWTSMNGKYGVFGEYRWAKNHSTNEKPRTEFNASIERFIMSHRHMNLAITFGGMYQVYYSEVPVWGIQGGIAARLY
jgi:hypothetical protein